MVPLSLHSFFFFFFFFFFFLFVPPFLAHGAWNRPCGSCCTRRRQGAIILATGGDNSNSASGNFYEGFMASGYSTDATDAAIQANIIAVGYSGFSTPHA